MLSAPASTMPCGLMPASPTSVRSLAVVLVSIKMARRRCSIAGQVGCGGLQTFESPLMLGVTR